MLMSPHLGGPTSESMNYPGERGSSSARNFITVSQDIKTLYDTGVHLTRPRTSRTSVENRSRKTKVVSCMRLEDGQQLVDLSL